jgi:hypothetical protein
MPGEEEIIAPACDTISMIVDDIKNRMGALGFGYKISFDDTGNVEHVVMEFVRDLTSIKAYDMVT